MRSGETLAGYRERLWQVQVRVNLFHMLAGLVLVLPILFLQVRLVGYFDLSALFAVVFFNLLFVFFVFPLEGPLSRKAVLLIVGNGVGALWYLIEFSFEDTLFLLNMESLRMLFLVAKPLIDFAWIVTIWSISLSMLSPRKGKMKR